MSGEWAMVNRHVQIVNESLVINPIQQAQGNRKLKIGIEIEKVQKYNCIIAYSL